MSFTYNLSTSVGQLRLLIGDTTQSGALFSDEELNAFLSMNSGDIFSSAALALRRIAVNKALIAKAVSAGNYSEDTRDIPKILLSTAKDLEAASKDIPADAQVEIIYNDFNYNNILRNRIFRNESLDDG